MNEDRHNLPLDHYEKWYDPKYLAEVRVKRLKKPYASTALGLVDRQRRILEEELGMEVPPQLEIYASLPVRLNDCLVSE